MLSRRNQLGQVPGVPNPFAATAVNMHDSAVGLAVTLTKQIYRADVLLYASQAPVVRRILLVIPPQVSNDALWIITNNGTSTYRYLRTFANFPYITTKAATGDCDAYDPGSRVRKVAHGMRVLYTGPVDSCTGTVTTVRTDGLNLATITTDLATLNAAMDSLRAEPSAKTITLASCVTGREFIAPLTDADARRAWVRPVIHADASITGPTTEYLLPNPNVPYGSTCVLIENWAPADDGTARVHVGCHGMFEHRFDSTSSLTASFARTDIPSTGVQTLAHHESRLALQNWGPRAISDAAVAIGGMLAQGSRFAGQLEATAARYGPVARAIGMAAA